MASSIDPPIPLRNKLNKVGDLLEDANKRLQEEVRRCEIFATKSSASAASGSSIPQNHQQQTKNQYVPSDLIRTISDISTLKTVLSCPIFNRIVNVTDSLDQLSYHLTQHPSIGSSDINIDDNGELILAPPLEPSSFNNLINSKLDEFSDPSNSSPKIVSPNNAHNNNNHAIINERQLQQQLKAANFNGTTDPDSCNGEFLPIQHHHKQLLEQNADLGQQFEKHQVQPAHTFDMSPNIISSLNSYDTEKLVSNGTNKTYLVCNSSNRQHDATKMYLINDDRGENRRLYKSNGNLKLDQIAPNSLNPASGFQNSQSSNRASDYIEGNGYCNELYKTTAATTFDSTRHEAQSQNIQSPPGSYIKNVQAHISPTNGRQQLSQVAGLQYNNRGSCSPSTSAGSTVRLADECDSGASSYQSKVTPYPSYLKPNEAYEPNRSRSQGANEDKLESMPPEVTDSLSPEVERIKVTLEKDSKGLGIMIAGYTLEDQEISGVFIKSIEPNSPADRSGKIRLLDQIFSVNGREILGYNNHDAVDMLKCTGKLVTLELMRYLAESNYRKLEVALARAVPSMETNQENAPTQNIRAQTTTNVAGNLKNLSLPAFKARANLYQSSIEAASPTATSIEAFQVTKGQGGFTSECRPVESMYKNKITSNNKANGEGVNIYSNQTDDNPFSDVPVKKNTPVAAQRSGTNKVIETLQGARNTIDIKSPACQATYVNKVVEMEHCDVVKKSIPNSLQTETLDEFGQMINLEWDQKVQIIELYKDNSQGLGFTVKDYTNPKDQKQSIIMITHITPGGIADRDGNLTLGDLLVFVDDTNLQGASLTQAVEALKKTNGQVSLGVYKIKNLN